MSFNSIHFLIFFPLVTIIYFLIPYKIKYLWLLISSYYFYMCWNPKYELLIAFSTITTYLSGIFIDKANNISDYRKSILVKRSCVALSFIINLGIMFLFKYYNFFTSSLAKALSYFNITLTIPVFDFLLPVGISFYTFQALSYTVDIYRKDIPAEKNLAKYALFVSFFPQLVAGPIEKSKDLLYQFNNDTKFEYYRVKSGLIQIMWWFFQKVFIADRLCILVNTVYNSPYDYAGFQIIIATLFFAFQIYCDFSAYSDIAIGCARVLGFNLTKNFRQPYFSKSIKEFWRRWHITLGSWFKDYLYIPLGGNRKGTFRTYVNIMIVFLSSGLWHGASITFVIWGALHGFYQVFADIVKPIKEKIHKIFNINTEVFSYKFFQILITFILVNFAWIFFRANSFYDAKIIVRNLFVFNPWILTDGSLYNLGLESKEFFAAIIGIIVLVFVDTLQTKYNLIDKLSEQNMLFRWSVYIITIVIILIFGIYGPGYNDAQFIYFQF